MRMLCPKCAKEFENDIEFCPDCDVKLLEFLSVYDYKKQRVQSKPEPESVPVKTEQAEEEFKKFSVGRARRFIKDKRMKSKAKLEYLSLSGINMRKLLLIGSASVILIFLLSIVGAYFFSIVPAQAYARDSVRVSDIYNIRLALAKYHTDNAVYPDTLQMLVPEYIDRLPEDPLEGMPIGNAEAEALLGSATFTYVYRVTDEGNAYTLLKCTEWNGIRVVSVYSER